MATTLSSLRSKAQTYLDDTAANVWTAAELNTDINDSERWLWNTLSNADPSFALRESTATLVQAQINYNYPSDILGRNIRALFAYTSGSDPWNKVEKAGLEELVAEGVTQRPYPFKYVSLDGYFQIGPPPDASGYTLRIYYHRKPTAMTQDSDPMDSDDVFAEVIAIGAAINALSRKNGDTSALEAKRKLLYEEAVRAATPEDIYQAKLVWKYKENW